MKETIVRDRKRLVLVDDDPNLNSLYKDYLEFRGYEVITAETSREALDFLEQDLPDLIISDVLRPEMDGYAFLDNIRQNVRTSWIPFLFLSAMMGQWQYQWQYRIKGFNLGADGCMGKPFEPEELVAQIEDLLRSVHPSASSSDPCFAQAVRLPYTIVPYIVSDYSGVYPDGTLVVYNTAGGEEVTTAGYAIAQPLPYFVATQSDQYPPSTLVVCVDFRHQEEVSKHGFAQAVRLPYKIVRDDSGDYPAGTLVVDNTTGGKEVTTAGYVIAQPLPYFVATQSDQYPPSTLVVSVDFRHQEARAAGYDNAISLRFRSNKVRHLGMLDTEYAALSPKEQNVVLNGGRLD